jgi:hypothetical protein
MMAQLMRPATIRRPTLNPMRLSWIAQTGLDRTRKKTTFQRDDTQGSELKLKAYYASICSYSRNSVA